MNVAFESSFARDLKRIKNRTLLQRIQRTISQIKAATILTEIRSIKKMQGYATFYRIRLGDYRIGLEVVDEQVVFVRILHRKDIYRYFP